MPPAVSAHVPGELPAPAAVASLSADRHVIADREGGLHLLDLTQGTLQRVVMPTELPLGVPACLAFVPAAKPGSAERGGAARQRRHRTGPVGSWEGGL